VYIVCAGFRALQHLQLQGAAEVKGAAINLRHCTGEEVAVNAVNRGYLSTLNYTKTVFDRGSAPDTAKGAHRRFSDPLVEWGYRGYTLPSPLPLRRHVTAPRAPRSPPKSVPPLLDQRQKSVTIVSLNKFCHACDCMSVMLCNGSYVNVKVRIKILKLNENVSLDYSALVCTM